jgi:hypothetical protein
MSADNYLIIIDEDKPCGDYALYMGCASTGKHDNEPLATSGDLKELIIKTQDYMMENFVEYGLCFDI